MQDINYEDAISCAKSFTEIAIQTQIIPSECDPKKTAEHIADFFNTFLPHLFPFLFTTYLSTSLC